MWLKYLTYAFLLISVLLLWVPDKAKIKLWQITLSLTLIFAYFSHIANFFAIFAIVILFCLVKTYHEGNNKWKFVLWPIVFFTGLAFELHFIPGFKNLLIVNKIQYTSDAVPFSMYLNLDKVVVGLIILGLTLNLTRTKNAWLNLFKQVVYRFPVIFIVMLGLSFLFGYVKLEPKLPQGLVLWMINNLFFVCLAEEGLFRGFFQETLSKAHYKYSEYVAVIIPALFFGAMHYPGGIKYVVLATLAGVLYGWVYKVTHRIEASMLTHFLLNLTHILFFTYPALMSV